MRKLWERAKVDALDAKVGDANEVGNFKIGNKLIRFRIFQVTVSLLNGLGMLEKLRSKYRERCHFSKNQNFGVS